MTSRLRFRVYVACAAITTSVFTLWLAFQIGGPRFTLAVDDLGAMGAAFLAAICSAVAAIRTSGATRRGWTLFGLSALAWGAGEAFWSYYELVAGREVPFPSLADLGYLGAIPLATAAMLAFSGRLVGLTARMRTLLDGLVIAASLLFISWATVLGPMYRAGGDNLLTEAIGLAYPLGDVLIASLVLFLAARADTHGRVPLAWLGAALVSCAVADTGYAILTQNGTYETGNLIDVGWFAGYLLMAVAALRPSVAMPTEKARSVRWTGLRLLVPYVPVALVGVIAIGRDMNGGLSGFLFWNAIVVVVLVLARQLLTLRENLSLTRHLETKVDERTRELLRSEDRMRAIVQTVSDVISVVDVDGHIAYQSAAVERILGHKPAETVGQNALAFVHDEDRAAIVDFLENTGRRSATRRVEARLRHRDGSWRHTETLGARLSSEPTNESLVLITRDVTERKELEEQLVHQAFHDSLTGLANRALFHDRLGLALARSSRSGSTLGLLLLDLDDFKSVNDSQGHPSGDELLQVVAHRLLSHMRPSDTVARLGGDEFAILVEDVTAGTAKELADRILDALSEPIELGLTEVVLGGSIGIVLSDGFDKQRLDLLRNADTAMYRAKALGKGRHAIFQEEMHEEALRRVQLHRDLRRAVEHDEFLLHYQPIFALSTGRLTGVEALLRWSHPERGMVPPVEFVGLAEESGKIVEIGRWVLEEACRQVREWNDTLSLSEPMGVSVNLSVRQLEHPDLVGHVVSALRTSGLPPAQLTLEITESVVMRDTQMAVERLQILKDLGIALAIDDFGTGYSSLGYLQRLPVDILKIDRSFVRDDTGDPDLTLARTMIQLAGSLGLTAVAEGIETESQLDRLRSFGCPSGQGYLFSRPLSANDLPSFVDAIGQDAVLAGV